ncbi:MAG: N-acetyltransferase, partial [Verrucomicrobiales bacterium]
RELLRWAKWQLGLNDIHVRVRSDNPALGFYRKVGFQEFQRVALRKTEHPNKIEWVEDHSASASEVQLVYMRIAESIL